MKLHTFQLMLSVPHSMMMPSDVSAVIVSSRGSDFRSTISE